MVTPYLRTEWAALWLNPLFEGDVQVDVPRQFGSALLAREFVEHWNSLYPDDPVKVVQRSISDWGDDE